MTEKELAAVISGIAPVIREAIAASVKDFAAKLEEVNKYATRIESYTSFLQRDAAALGERVAIVETKTGVLVPLESELFPVLARLKALEDRPAVEGLPGRDGRDGLPGVPGLPGEKGLDGLHGKDGIDGLGFEDLDVSLSGDRTLVFRFANGAKEKTFRVDVGWPKYQQRWVQGKAYVPGDVVTWDGHLWDCQDATDDGQPGVSKAWMQSVTRGRAGKDGKDGKDWAPPPVVKIGGVTR